MRTHTTEVAVAPQFYGGIQPQAMGLQEFSVHDASKTWEDGGRHQELLQQGIAAALEQVRATLAPEIKRYGAEQVREGVADYVANCYFEAGVVGDDIHIAVDASNNEATFRVHVPLIEVLAAAAADALKRRDTFAANYLNEVVGVLEEMKEPLQQQQAAKEQQQAAKTVEIRIGAGGSGGRGSSISAAGGGGLIGGDIASRGAFPPIQSGRKGRP